MIAQNSYGLARPASRHARQRRKMRPIATFFKNPIVCILLVAAVSCVVASIYISAYAVTNEKGNQKASLSMKLKAIRLENDRMRLELDKLRKPDEITKFATSKKMKQNEEMAYLSPTSQPKVAQNTD
ncbi:MAG: hypothetical protein ACYC0V_00745 [Armatimonadota bacterium]